MSTYYPNNGPDLLGTSLRPDGQLIFWNYVYLLESGNKRQFYSDAARSSYSFTSPLCYDSGTDYPNGTTLKARQGTRFKSSSSGAQYMLETTATGFHRRPLTNGGLSLAHDGMTNEWFDEECGGRRVPVTIMDYDCESTAAFRPRRTGTPAG
jgi:hypothetical protein